MAFSTYLANKINNLVLRATAYTPPTGYLALYTSNPADDNSGTEVSGGSYARQTLTCDVSASKATANTSLVTFPTATASWGTVTHFGILDASTSGNLLIYGSLTSSKTVASGDVLQVAAGDLDVALT